MLKPYHAYLDFLRIVATLGVVFIHVSSSRWGSTFGTTEWGWINVYDSIARWSVPIFFMISGALFLSDTEPKPLKTFLLKSPLKVVVLLLFWGFIYQLWRFRDSIFAGEITISMVVSTVKAFLSGNPWPHLWFLYSILGLYLITPFIKRAVQASSRSELRYTIILFIIFAGIVPFVGAVLKMQVVSVIPEFAGYLGYYLLGYYLFTYSLSKRTEIITYVTAGVAVIITVIGTALLSTANNAANDFFYQYNLVTHIAIATAVFLAAKRVVGPTHQSITTLSGLTLGVYVTHMLVIQVLKNYTAVNTGSLHTAVSVPLLVVTVTTASLIITFLLKKIPLIGKWIV